jgi:hypothetical protein
VVVALEALANFVGIDELLKIRARRVLAPDVLEVNMD